MNGLRVYIITNVAETRGGYDIFYSRRENGPFYRWAYEQKSSQWRVARVHSSDFTAKILSPKSWKIIPSALQRSIVEHYQD